VPSQIALVIAFVAFVALLVHLLLGRGRGGWEREKQIPLHDETPQTPFEGDDAPARASPQQEADHDA